MADVARTLEDEGVASFAKSFDELIQTLTDKATALAAEQLSAPMDDDADAARRGSRPRRVAVARRQRVGQPAGLARRARAAWPQRPATWPPGRPGSSSPPSCSSAWAVPRSAPPCSRRCSTATGGPGRARPARSWCATPPIRPPSRRSTCPTPSSSCRRSPARPSSRTCCWPTPGRSCPTRRATRPSPTPAPPWPRWPAERGLRTACFENPPDIGGRYSVLSYFGMVPAALIGYDVAALCERALDADLRRGGRPRHGHGRGRPRRPGQGHHRGPPGRSRRSACGSSS